MFWMSDQVRHDESGTFYETININRLQKLNPSFWGTMNLVRGSYTC